MPCRFCPLAIRQVHSDQRRASARFTAGARNPSNHGLMPAPVAACCHRHKYNSRRDGTF